MYIVKAAHTESKSCHVLFAATGARRHSIKHKADAEGITVLTQIQTHRSGKGRRGRMNLISAYERTKPDLYGYSH